MDVKKLMVLFALILLGRLGISQNVSEEGVVTFTTSSNVYVRFESTADIEVGDTLYIIKESERIPCLVVSQKSSNSTVNTIINNCPVQKDDVILFSKMKVAEEVIEDVDIIPETVEGPPEGDEEEVEQEEKIFRERLNGRLSFASYSNFSSNGGDDQHRLMLRGSVNAQNINDGRVSFESYVNYRQNMLQPGADPDIQTQFFRVYNLSLTIDVSQSMQVSLGRKINRKVSSLGAIDGLQVEKYFGNFFVGAIGGYKPDLFKFDFNDQFFQVGGYVGFFANKSGYYAQSTFGLLEQKNGSATDRRYAYFQHSSRIGRNLHLFGSAEVDLYQNVNGSINSQPRLTNLYASLRYRFSKAISLMVSYDTRKRVIYYETLRTEVEKLLADDQARQGIRARLQVRPMKYINVGVGYSRRFQNDNQNRADNMNAYISHSKLPGIGGRLAINATMNESNYLKTRIIGARYSRSLIRKKVSGDLYFRRIEYRYGGNEVVTFQDYLGVNINIRLAKKLSLNLLGEIGRRVTVDNYRINTRLIKRF